MPAALDSLAGTLSVLAADALLYPPIDTLRVEYVSDAFDLVLFLGVAVGVSSATDALRRSERQARERQAEIETIYRGVPVGLCVLDRDLRFVRVNARLAEQTGLPLEAHKGKRVREVLPELADRIEPLLRRVYETGERHVGREEPLLLQRTEGRPPEETFIDFVYEPLRDASGETTGVFAHGVDVTDLVRARRKAEAATRARDAGIELCQEAGDSLPVVRVDPDGVQRVFANLISNAIRYTPEGGRASVGADAADGQVVFHVSDTGPGIPEADRERLFERFWQADRNDTTGAGLGLAIARTLVEARDGRIWVESELGAGSTFYVGLPVANEM